MLKSLTLYNTAIRDKQILTPLKPERVTVYTCGPTVYGFQSIGNYRTYIFEDVLVKSLRYFGYTVDRVMNITDVGHLTSDQDEGEDKMEVGAKRDGSTAWDVAENYTKAFLSDLPLLHIETPKRLIRATDAIPVQIKLIQELEAKGFTYKTEDGIYFDSSKFPTYGEMAHLDIAGLQAGARVEMQAGKRGVTDFALWKFSKPDSKRDMEWESPWGVGFPGWHLECSAIALSQLGEQLDIHCGGVDHIPVHHTNEIAQSEAATGKPFVQIWCHGDFLLIDGGKMSKSLQNIYTLQDLKEQGIHPLAFRYFTYTAHYRSKLNFTWEAVKAAQTSWERLRAQVPEQSQVENKLVEPDPADVQRVEAAVLDDLNMPEVIAAFWEILRSSRSSEQKRALIEHFESILSLGLLEPEISEVVEIPQEVLELINRREEARKTQDWPLSDQLRSEIEQLGFTVKDNPTGPSIDRLEKK